MQDMPRKRVETGQPFADPLFSSRICVGLQFAVRELHRGFRHYLVFRASLEASHREAKLHSANLGLRFLLELAALAGLALWAAGFASGPIRFVLAAAAVLVAGVLWTVFAVPDDPSRSGTAPVPVPGAVRLLLEFAILFGGAWGFRAAGFTDFAIVLAGLIVVHYALWTERIVWLLRQ